MKNINRRNFIGLAGIGAMPLAPGIVKKADGQGLCFCASAEPLIIPGSPDGLHWGAPQAFKPPAIFDETGAYNDGTFTAPIDGLATISVELQTFSKSNGPLAVIFYGPHQQGRQIFLPLRNDVTAHASATFSMHAGETLRTELNSPARVEVSDNAVLTIAFSPRI